MRTFLIVLVLVVAGVIGAVLWLLRDPNTLRPELESLIESQSGLKVDLGGDLSWRLWPPVQLVAKDVSADWNDPGTDPLLKASVLRLDADLWPLLGSNPRLVIQGIAVDGLHARLVETDGVANWMPPGYTGDAPPPIPVPTPTDSPVPADEWVVHAIEIRNSQVDYTEDGDTYHIDIAELAIASIAPDREVPVAADFKITSGDDVTTAQAAGKVTFDAAFTRWSVRDLVLEGESSSIDGPFTASFDADADVRAETFTVSNGEVTFAGVSATLTASGSQLLTNPTISGKLDLPAQNLAKALAPYDVEVPETVGIRGDFEATQTSMKLSNAEVKYDGLTARGDIGIQRGERSRATFDVNIDRYEVPKQETQSLAISGAPFPFAMFAAPAITVDPSMDEPLIPLDSIREYDWAGTARVATLVYDGVEFPNAVIETSNASGLVKAQVALPAFFGGRADTTVTVDARTDEPVWTVTPKLADVQTEPLIKFLDQRLDWVALLAAGSDLTMRGNTARALIASVKGKTTFDGGKGKLNIADIKRQVQSVALLAGKDDRVAKWPDVLNYQRFTGNWTVDGKQHDLAVELDNLTLAAHGTYDPLADDMDIRLGVTAKTIPELTSFQIDPLFMDVEIPLRCRGTTVEPQCTADQDGVKRLIAGALSGGANPEMQKKIDKAIEENVPEDQREAARALIRGFGDLLSKPPPQPSTPPPAQ